MKDKIILILIFSLFSTILVLSALYVHQIQKFPEVILDNETINNMSKEEIIAFYEERENIAEKDLTSEILMVLVGIVGFLLGAGTVYLISKEPQVNVEIEGILSIAPKNEREVIKVLIEKGGEAPQYYIRQRIGINKVAMTRLVEKMEKEGIIEVTRGRVNHIRLSKTLMKTLKELNIL